MPIWAPWRMEYILAPKGPGTACPFCGIASDEPAERRRQHVLARRSGALVLLNRYPFAAGHLLVLPERHAGDIADLNAAEHDALFALVRDAVVALRAAVRLDGVNVGMNLGRAAGAGVTEHVHAHVVPRWEGDTNFMPVLADVRVMPQHLDATFDALLPHFRALDRG